MRDPARIDVVLNLIERYWKKYPDLRLGQLLVNVSEIEMPYYLEDDVVITSLNEALKKEKSSEN